MSKKIAKYQLPHGDADLDELIDRLFFYAGPRIEGDSAAGTPPVWTDIPVSYWLGFKTARLEWKPAYEACKSPHLPPATERKKLKRKALCDAIDDLIGHGLLVEPRTAEDVVAMGFKLIDDNATHPTEITDTVEFDSIVNDIIPGSHTQIVNYRIFGRATKAKTPYHAAVFQVCIRGPDEPAPDLNNDADWGKDILNMNSPLRVQHKRADSGKIAYYRGQWEAEGGLKGPWAMDSAEIP
jgi:hypothetical protein